MGRLFILVAARGIVYSHTLCVRGPFQIATVSLRYTCKTCYFVGPWGPYSPQLYQKLNPEQIGVESLVAAEGFGPPTKGL